ncbi:hypothetical protein BKI52_26190 [marine bacterium AO1-C]|nr:hypothetical protein BKI52_26190 [marine bacterium AO1-C]
MDTITQDWIKIRQHVNKSFRQNLHVAIASVGEDNLPTVTPIGTLFLNRDHTTGFYFEKYPSRLPKHAEVNPNICVLAVNTSKWFWIKALFRNRFKQYPAIKLYGKLGERRNASSSELNRLNRRMKRTRKTKGHQYLWGDMKTIREVNFTKAEVIKLGKMTHKL